MSEIVGLHEIHVVFIDIWSEFNVESLVEYYFVDLLLDYELHP